MIRLVWLVSLAACVLVPATPTRADHLGRDNPAARKLEKAAVDLINEAARPVWANAPCRMRPFLERGHRPALTDADPSPAMLSALGILRRPATPTEVLAAETNRFAGPGVEEVYRRGTRIVALPDGTQVTLRAHSRVRRTGIAPDVLRDCQARVVDAVRRVGRARPTVRRRALAMLAESDRAQRDEPALPEVTEGLALDVRHAGERGGGGTAGPFVAERFASQGIFMSSGGRARRGAPARSKLVGVVPDPVATAELEWTRFASRGRYRDPIDYGRRHVATVRVVDNVLSVSVPRVAEHAFPERMVWRDATGAVVRVVRPPR